MDSATTGIIGTAELQDLTTNTVNSTAVPADVNQVIAAAAAAASVTAEEAANAVSKIRSRGYNLVSRIDFAVYIFLQQKIYILYYITPNKRVSFCQ